MYARKITHTGDPSHSPKRANADDKSVPSHLRLETVEGWQYPRLLVVDDDSLVLETYAAMLQAENYMVCCAGSVAEARAYLEKETFDLVLCDIFMPGENGLVLLTELVQTHPELPVVLITAFATVDMAREALHQGASDFITKPCGPGELPIVIERNLTRRSVERHHAMHHRRALQDSHESVLDALLSALSTRDTETQGHSERVTAYTMEMAERMLLSSEERYHIERGALLHDIGKIGIPDRILLKPGRLSEEEWVEMRKHPEIGHQMCARIPMLQRASEIVLHHHEAWDGGGYPGGLMHEDIPLGARIFAIADTLDAITSDRPYRAASSFGTAREEILRFSGRMFDPEVVKVFLSISEDRWRQIRELADK